MPPNHLFESLSPILFVSLLVGTSPIYLHQQNEKYSLRISQVFKIICMFYISIYTCSLIFGASSFNSTSIKYLGNTMSTIGLVLDTIGQILLVYVIYIFGFFTSTQMKNVIEQIASIDSVLCELGHKNNYYKTFWQQIVLLGVGITSIVIAISTQLYIMINQSMFNISETLWFVYYFPIIIIFIMECQFSFTVFLIYQRLQIINNLLNKTSSRMKIKHKPGYPRISQVTDIQMVKPNELPPARIIKNIETIMLVHDSVVDVASDLNNIYSFQILLCLAIMFIKSVFAIFFSYFELLVVKKTDIFLNWFSWIVIDWNEILLITVVCHLATGQSQQTGIEVHKMLMNSDNIAIRDKLMIFSQQVFHRPIDFTACGLFSINAELIFTILGAATTYLLIMLQFQEGNEANCIITNSTIQ